MRPMVRLPGVREFRHGGGGSKTSFPGAHGEERRRGRKEREGSQTPDDP